MGSAHPAQRPRSRSQLRTGTFSYQRTARPHRGQRDAGRTIKAFKVDGGACANDLLMQFQADLLGVPVVRPRVTQTTALGAAYLAGLATGFVPRPFEHGPGQTTDLEPSAGWDLVARDLPGLARRL